MRFVALVSGGKDSCYNIMHCLNAGHELVAMANLHPRSDRPDEIDSWMFQTVGYKTVAYIAECANVPLFRAEISENEEAVVDEMASLFKDIKEQIDFDAVSAGAIGSTYQQVRVDRACEMIGLRSLTYLWQRDQSELLREIVASGLDARIIKVAGMGLSARHLGKPLSAVADELILMHNKFGLHPCGEGGEYETMVFDAPFFTSKRLVIVPGSEHTVTHSSDDVYYLEFEVATEPKNEPPQLLEVEVPQLMGEPFADILDRQESIKVSEAPDVKFWPKMTTYRPLHHAFTARGTFEQVFDDVKAFLEEVEEVPGVAACYHVAIVIKSMSRFAEMNALYIDAFQQTAKGLGDIPPSRQCVQAAIPWDIEITILQTRKQDPSGKGIHVQGLSYWAPASIGPYSQCRLVYGLSYVAGQIGLIPQSLAVVRDDVEAEALLALQNTVRVLNVMHEAASNWTPRSAIVYITSAASLPLVQRIWSRFSSIPLVAAVIEKLPRDANVEWTVQACDLRYFSWYIPDNDDDEELYSVKPEILYSFKTGYIFRAGSQILQVRCDAELEEASLVFSPRNRATNQRHWVPVSDVYFNGTKVDEVYFAC